MLTWPLLYSLDRQLDLPVFVSLQRSYRDPSHGRLVGEPVTRPPDGDGTSVPQKQQGWLIFSLVLLKVFCWPSRDLWLHFLKQFHAGKAVQTVVPPGGKKMPWKLKENLSRLPGCSFPQRSSRTMEGVVLVVFIIWTSLPHLQKKSRDKHLSLGPSTAKVIKD